jgi:pilus assembly protein Flp/PilA
MKKLLGWYIRFKTGEKGATAVEYGLIIALIAVAIVSIVAILGGQIAGAFQAVVDELTAAGVGV